METQTETKKHSSVICSVTGALTVHARKHSRLESILLAAPVAIEKLYDNATRQVYEQLGRLASERELVVPKHFGIGFIEPSYRAAEPIIKHKIEKHPDEQVVLVGHSLGGMLAARYGHEHPDEVSAVITVASPHSGIRRMPFGLERLFGLDKKFFHENTDRIHELRSELGTEAPLMVQIASSADGIVPVRSALHNFEGPQMVLISTGEGESYGAEVHLDPHPPGHLDVVRHIATLNVCRMAVQGNSPMPEAA